MLQHSLYFIIIIIILYYIIIYYYYIIMLSIAKNSLYAVVLTSNKSTGGS